MALVGTISGSNGTSITAISGSLIIADSSLANFPSLPQDIILFVSGNIGGNSKTVIGGDLVVSGAAEFKNPAAFFGSLSQKFSNDFENFNFTSQSFVGVDTSLSSYTGTLPVISGEYVGRLYNIKDVGGLCATNAFVVTASLPNKIDGATELKLSSTSGSISLIAGLSGSSYNWYIMSYT
jgi:hypothetical protein